MKKQPNDWLPENRPGGQQGYLDFIHRLRVQRERTAERLKRFARNIHIMKQAVDIIEEAKKNNPNNLPF